MNTAVSPYSNKGQVNNVSNGIIQASLQVGAANDPLEHEADAVTDQVMRMPENGLIQRKCSQCDEQDKAMRKPLASFIQKKGEGGGIRASDSVSNRIHNSRGKGNNLSGNTKGFMESRFGTEFSNVNIHTGREATQLSQDLGAKAFTVGNDIYFNSGQYAPDTSEGKHLLAHELTHTVQQDAEGKRVQRTVTGPEVIEQDDKAPQERDMCEGWESDLESLTIDAARFHFRTEHGETIQVQTMDCVSGTSVTIKACDLILSDGRQVTVQYNPEQNIIRVHHFVSGVLKFCRYSYTCSYGGSVRYTKLNCNE